MKTLHIKDEVHEELKKFCKEHGYQVNKLSEIIINDFLKSTFRVVNNKSLSNDNK